MSFLVDLLLTNAIVLTLLAGLAWLVNLKIRRSAWVYGIWLLVLLRAWAPPLLPLPVLPGDLTVTHVPVATPAGDGLDSRSAVEAGLQAESAKPGPDAPLLRPDQVDAPAAGNSWKHIFGAVSLTGCLFLLSFSWLRGRRFEKWLELGAGGDADEIGEPAAEVAEQVGVRCPPVRLVEARISPLLWHRPGRLAVVIPRLLWETLNDRERRLLLAHEFVHLKRKDHWVRLFENLTAACYWWHPAVHLSRSRLRQAEEQCCDAEVLRHFPGAGSDYARSLCKVADFLAGGRMSEPRFCTAIGPERLEERIRRIMQNKSSIMGFPRWQKMALMALCGWALVLFPTWAETPAQEQARPASDVRVEELRQQTAALERELRELRARQAELQSQRLQAQYQADSRRLENQAADLQAAGRNQEAEWLRKQQTLMARRVQLERDQLQLEFERLELQADLESRRKAHEAELVAAAANQEDSRIAELKLQMAQLESEADQVRQELDRRRLQLQKSQIDLEADFQRIQLEHLRQEGHDAEAEAREAELRLTREMRLLELEREETQRRLHRLQMLQEQIMQAARQAAELRRQGKLEQAEQLERQIQKLKEQMDEPRRPGS